MRKLFNDFTDIMVATTIAITLAMAIASLAGCATYAPEQVTQEDATRAGMESVRTFAWGSLGPSSVRTP